MSGTTPKHLTDRYGLRLTTGSPLAVEHYVAGLDLLLSYNLGPEYELRKALEADPEFALAYGVLAVIYQLQGRMDEARQYVQQALTQTSFRPVTRREQQHLEALNLVMTGEASRALTLIREHLAEFPRDALLLFAANSLLMFSGLFDRHAQSLALLESLETAYGEDWWFLGLKSFICHELDRFEESARLSERSLALNPRNANAVHNLSHVYLETAELSAGLDFLVGWLTAYPPEAIFYCHLSWHQALFELLAGHEQRALQLFETAIQGNLNSRSALPDGASLLWRLQLYHHRQPSDLPWPAARELAERLAPQPGFAFNDAHAALVYAALKDQAAFKNLEAGLQELTAKGNAVAGEVVLPLARGLEAFGNQDYLKTIEFIEPIRPQIVRLGGSQAQREVFEDTLIVAYLKTGQPSYHARAADLLNQRLTRRQLSRDFAWLKQAQSS
jgi:hypothetical protein